MSVFAFAFSFFFAKLILTVVCGANCAYCQKQFAKSFNLQMKHMNTFKAQHNTIDDLLVVYSGCFPSGLFLLILLDFN